MNNKVKLSKEIYMYIKVISIYSQIFSYNSISYFQIHIYMNNLFFIALSHIL